ncbi:MAG: DNA polymerase III subunit delta' [Gammaproteobacteria bacterium]
MSIFPWQQELWQRLVNAKTQQRMPHAWLVSGGNGVGKNHFAYEVAGWLLCSQNSDTACGECRACRLWASQQHPDFYELSSDDESKLNMATARELKIKLSDSAQQNGARVIVIKSAEQLTTPAANALLKLIEEPPAEVYFLLITSRPILLPITLRSRCQNLHIPTPGPEQTIVWLKTQGDFAAADITKALHLTFGSPLGALAMLSKPNLIAAQEEKTQDFLAVLSGKQSALSLAAKWASLEAEDLFLAIEYVLRRLARQAVGVNNQAAAKVSDAVKWFKLYEFMLRSHQQLLQVTGLNRQLFWENFLLKCQY